MTSRPVPTVRRRRLGTELRRLRNDAGMTLDQVAEHMSWDATKVSRVENATRNVRPPDVGRLLRIFGVDDPELCAALEALARDAGKRGWWQTYGGVLASTYADYISLESDAESLRTYEPSLIPGLLQTAAYAREIVAGTTTRRTPQEVSALVDVRRARQAILTAPDRPLELWAIVSETALRQRFAVRPETMREQLQKLLDTWELPNVTIQVMPMEATVHPGCAGGFKIVSFPGPVPDVVSLENLIGATYVEGTDDVAAFGKAFERIRSTALSEEDSLALITELEGKQL
ncbi:helix-turn-helix transcriptional regulator [Embleya sp. NPDC005575]|uniref:helix-turn-helix domain-containing protein n=1 Tax=Embleya sp. NPDC005575 TaxID=3156892 RepID=UPI0033BBEFAE